MAHDSGDAINEILGADAAAAVAHLRDSNPVLRAELQTYDAALFRPEPESEAAFSLSERCTVAVRIAAHTNSRAVMDWYGDRAREAGADHATLTRATDLTDPWSDQTRLGAAIRHADIVTTAPATTGPEHLAALKAAGFSPAGTLSLAQTIAYVNYQLRLVAGFRALAGQAGSGSHRVDPIGAPPGEAFTIDLLGWAPWMERATDTPISEERRAAIAAHIGKVPHSDYLLVLANDFPALVARAAVHKHVYVPGETEHTALSELGATIASRINGCVYCASVHARRYAALVKSRNAILRVLKDGLDAELSPIERATADVAAKLTVDPEGLTPSDLESLRSQGVDDLAILDVLNYTAFFANANRLMLTLGAPPE